MIEITLENAHGYLFNRGLIPTNEAVEIIPLGGGISNIVMMVTWPGDGFVFKQALPKLRVKEDWPFDISRIFIERDCMSLMGEMLPPGSLPVVRFSDEENYIFGMSIAPQGGILWKDELMAGKVDIATARRCGHLLGQWHIASSASEKVRDRFDSNVNFIQGRIDPYHWTTAKAHPDVASLVHAEVDRMLATKITLVHGDFSPKNIFAYPDRVLTLDLEVAHWGDPVFDVAFCLNHLILKSILFHGNSEMYLDAAQAFLNAYRAETNETDYDLSPIVHQLGCLLLARIDGKSKVEYITQENHKQLARKWAKKMLRSQDPDVDSVVANLNRSAQ